MYDFLKAGEEVTFPGLLDITLIVVEVNENRGNALCKYFDENLNRYIKLTLSVDSLVPNRTPSKNQKTPVLRRVSIRRQAG